MAAAKPTPAADNSAAVKRDCALLSQFLYENKVHIKLSVTSDKFSKEFDVFQISDAETALEIATFCRTRLGFTVEKAERDRKRALLLNFASQQGLDESGILALLRRDDEKAAVSPVPSKQLTVLPPPLLKPSPRVQPVPVNEVARGGGAELAELVRLGRENSGEGKDEDGAEKSDEYGAEEEGEGEDEDEDEGEEADEHSEDPRDPYSFRHQHPPLQMEAQPQTKKPKVQQPTGAKKPAAAASEDNEPVRDDMKSKYVVKRSELLPTNRKGRKPHVYAQKSDPFNIYFNTATPVAGTKPVKLFKKQVYIDTVMAAVNSEKNFADVITKLDVPVTNAAEMTIMSEALEEFVRHIYTRAQYTFQGPQK